MDVMKIIKRLMPASPEALTSNRLLRRFTPSLSQPDLWRMRRRNTAVGAAIGVFFAFIIPVGQIPLAALSATVLRGNIPVACLATFVNTPLTFGPVYYFAYRLGELLVGNHVQEIEFLGEVLEEKSDWLTQSLGWLQNLGPALAVGTALLAVSGAAIAYVSISVGWRVVVLARWRRRRNERG